MMLQTIALLFCCMLPGAWPDARSYHAAVYDAGRERLVVFGGNGPRGSYLDGAGAIWEWDGTAWTRFDAAGPGPRDDASLVYDPVRHRVLLYGGRRDDITFDDLWSWNGREWALLAAHGPGGRHLTMVGFDEARGELVVHGGHEMEPDVLRGDTWIYGTAGWRKATSPDHAAHFAGAMAFDPVSRSLILHGGHGEHGPERATWRWDGAAWQLVTNSGPANAAHQGMTSTSHSLLLMTSAMDPSTQPLELWEFAGDSWRRVSTGPAWRTGYSVSYDTTRARLILFGGAHSPAQKLNDLWIFDGAHWQTVIPEP